MNPPIDDGGPAFPMGMAEGALRGHGPYSQKGMPRRDWLAGLAMQAYVAHLSRNDHTVSSCHTEIGAESYRIADAVIAAGKEAAQ